MLYMENSTADKKFDNIKHNDSLTTGRSLIVFEYTDVSYETFYRHMEDREAWHAAAHGVSKSQT